MDIFRSSLTDLGPQKGFLAMKSKINTIVNLAITKLPITMNRIQLLVHAKQFDNLLRNNWGRESDQIGHNSGKKG